MYMTGIAENQYYRSDDLFRNKIGIKADQSREENDRLTEKHTQEYKGTAYPKMMTGKKKQ